MVKLYSICTTSLKIYLRNRLHKTRLSRDEDLTSYRLKVSQLNYQLQGLGEVVSDFELTTCILNALPLEWSSFVTSIYSRKNTPNFDELWSLCILGETRLKAKDDTEPNEKSQAFATRLKKKKGKFGRFEARQRYDTFVESYLLQQYTNSKCLH